jgi:hypothetical protein
LASLAVYCPEILLQLGKPRKIPSESVLLAKSWKSMFPIDRLFSILWIDDRINRSTIRVVEDRLQSLSEFGGEATC